MDQLCEELIYGVVGVYGLMGWSVCEMYVYHFGVTHFLYAYGLMLSIDGAARGP